MPLSGTITWLNIKDGLPPKYEAVIVSTPHCSHPACIGFYNGRKWIGVDQRTVIHNVEHFAYINSPNDGDQS